MTTTYTNGTRNGPINGAALIKSGKPSNRHLLVTPQLVWKTEQNDEEPQQVATPVDVAFLSQGSLVVSELNNKRLQVFNHRGQSTHIIGEGRVAPRGLEVLNETTGDVAVVDAEEKTVKVFKNFGEDEVSWNAEMFGNPHGLARTSRGYFIITDTDPDFPKVHICDSEGKVVREFGSTEKGIHHLISPCYVSIDQHDRMIIADYENHCIKAFDKTGSLLQVFGSYGNKDGQLIHPTGVFADYMDNIFVADNGNHRISLFSAAGNFIQHILSEDDSISWPEAVSVSSGSQLAVTENGTDRESIKVYNM